MIPYTKVTKLTIIGDSPYGCKSYLYTSIGLCSWGSSGDDVESNNLKYVRYNIGVNYLISSVIHWGIEAGMLYLNKQQWSSSVTSLYLGATISLGGLAAYHVKEIQPPLIQLIASFADADKNQVLSKNEEGTIAISVNNKAEGKAKDVRFEISVLEKEFQDRIVFRNSMPIGDISGYNERSVNIPIKAQGELPKGKFTIKTTCFYKTEWGEQQSKTEQITVNTAPTTGMIKVAFTNLSTDGLPSWIAPTSLEHADYKVEYKGNSVSVLNLNTGERKTETVYSISHAQNFVRDYFLSWDKAAPQITLSSSGGTVNTENIKLSVRLSDDRKINEMKLYLNNQLTKTESFTEATETERTFTLPLQMGDNTIRITLTDWVDKTDEKKIVFTRIRGGSGMSDVSVLPQGEPPPDLTIQAVPLDGNNIVVGGREEGLRVIVSNNGKGTAKWVRVLLEGDDYLVSSWGKERNLEDIKPNETKSATFSLLMPSELPRREATLQVSVKEGRGYSPTTKSSLTFMLVPAEITTKVEEIVEDVDYDIPTASIKRDNGYALIIGFSKYLNVSAPKYSKNDAEVFTKYVSRVFGISNINIKTIYDEKATSATIKANLTDWMKRKTGFKVIYFAGHGVPDPENPREGDVFVLPYDGDPELKSTLISVKELSELGSNTGDTVLLFLDACFSGGEGRTVELASRPLVVAEIPKTNAITFAAAEGSQPSKEFEKAQHGYFTYYTLLGLKGKADVNDDGWITTTELYNYVKTKVSDATNNIQIPVLRPEKEIRIGRAK